MKTQPIIVVLVLALLGTYGCVPAVLNPIGNHHIVEQKRSELTDPVAPYGSMVAPVPSLEPSTQPSVETQEQVVLDKIVQDNSQRVTPTRSPREPEAAPAIKPKEQPAGASHKAQRPQADDRLSNLVDKDIDKAVEQPPQNRRLQFSKAVIEHPKVRHYIREFSVNQKDFFAKSLARSGRYFPMIASVLREEGLPEELAYLALVESNFFPQASSPAGAVGLWQFIPATGRRYGLRIDSWVDERRDPTKATRAAAAHGTPADRRR